MSFRAFLPEPSASADTPVRRKAEKPLKTISSEQCHIEENLVRMDQKWRVLRDPHKQFFLRPKVLGITSFVAQPLYKDKSFLTQKYVIEGLSARQIAAEIFSSKSAVTAALSRFEIPIREQHHHHGHPSQPKYGSKVRKGREQDHIAERRVIETVRTLRGEGMSLRKIANVLDQMKIPTKCRGKKWHPQMVQRMLSL